jgi:hypothetical protein
MGEITRRWPFDFANQAPFELVIREPPLTGDFLGLKTWGSSYVLAQLLPRFATTTLSHLFSSSQGSSQLPVLELGSGTGLLGLAAACAWHTSVVLTDLPAILPNLSHNAKLNTPTLKAFGGACEALSLTWGSPEDTDTRFHKLNEFKVRFISP